MNNNNSPRPHFPVHLIIHNGDLILAAAHNHAETGVLQAKVKTDVAGQMVSAN